MSARTAPSSPADTPRQASCFARHQGDHLNRHRQRLIDRCIDHLVDTYRIAGRQAEPNIARQAWGEIEARQVRHYFDLSRSTSHMIVLTDPLTVQTKMLTVADVLSLVGLAPQAPEPALAETG